MLDSIWITPQMYFRLFWYIVGWPFDPFHFSASFNSRLDQVCREKKEGDGFRARVGKRLWDALWLAQDEWGRHHLHLPHSPQVKLLWILWRGFCQCLKIIWTKWMEWWESFCYQWTWLKASFWIFCQSQGSQTVFGGFVFSKLAKMI